MSTVTIDKAAPTRKVKYGSMSRDRTWALRWSYFFLTLFAIFSLVPPFYMLITSLKTNAEISAATNPCWVFHPTLTVTFCTLIMIGYFASIPKELDEAAIIDGASWFQTLTRIFIPVALPGIIAATIFAFTVSWAQFLYPLVFTTSADQLVLPVGIITSLIKGDVF